MSKKRKMLIFKRNYMIYDPKKYFLDLYDLNKYDFQFFDSEIIAMKYFGIIKSYK